MNYSRHINLRLLNKFRLKSIIFQTLSSNRFHYIVENILWPIRLNLMNLTLSLTLDISYNARFLSGFFLILLLRFWLILLCGFLCRLTLINIWRTIILLFGLLITRVIGLS